MAVAEGNERVQVVLNEKVVARVDALAERMHMTRTGFLSCLIEIAVDDQEMLIKLVAGFVDLVKSVKGKKGTQPEKA